MSEGEGFLARWSRRKRAAATQAENATAAGESPPVSPAEPAIVPSPDLPPIESIGSGSDIAAFLAPGVPPELTRAALRRAWTADPAIRDFIGLSENAWDFTAADGMPGFGSLDPDQVQRLVERFLGEPEPADPTNAPAETPEASQRAEDAAASATDTKPPEPIAKLAEEKQPASREFGAPRRHGGALPQ